MKVQCSIYDMADDDFNLEMVEIKTLLDLQHFDQVGNVINYDYYEDLFTRREKLQGILNDNEENTTTNNREIPERKLSRKTKSPRTSNKLSLLYR